MTVEDKPDVTYEDVGGAKDALEKLREVVELPLLHPERFVTLGIDPPKGVLLFGPPGTGKTLSARAVANRTDACFIRVIGSELVQKYVGEGARMVRELFTMARSKKACIVFFDEIDAIGEQSIHVEKGGGEVQGRTHILRGSCKTIDHTPWGGRSFVPVRDFRSPIALSYVAKCGSKMYHLWYLH